ncbi:multidrug effflux MFS transporter [Pseudoalteromonas sp. SS15]|uniref:multidrug effflux MFS transporter n=1 Tax=Pseudoalteromonas sp. SS15 TaxID=3139393 RepID=UPI003BAAB65B
MSDPQINSKLSVFILILLVIFCPLGIDLYLPAFPAMQQGLSVSNEQVQQTVGIYMLTVGLGQLIAGPLADRYGRRPIALVGISLFALGGLLAANTNDWCVIMTARALQGFGACATFVTAFAIVRDQFGHKGSGKMITYLNGIVCFIPALAPIFGAWLTVQFGWQSNFIFLVIFAVLGFILLFLLCPETRPKDTIYSGHILDLRRFQPMLSSSEFMFNACITMVAMSAMLVFVTTAPEWVMTQLNKGISEFTIWFTVNAIISIAASFIAPKYIQSAPKQSLIFGLALLTLGGLFMMVLSSVAEPVVFMLPMYIASIGFAFTLGSAAGKALGGFAQQAGTASALIGVMQMSGAAVLAVLTQQFGLSAPVQVGIHLTTCLLFLIALKSTKSNVLYSNS